MVDARGPQLTFEGLSDAQTRILLQPAMPGGYADALLRFFVDGSYDDSRVLPTVQALTGNAPRTFEPWASAHAAAFRPAVRWR